MTVIAKPRSVRAVLVLFALCIVMPATAAVGGMVGWNVLEVRRSQQAELLAVARSASRTVDLRMTRLSTVAEAIATSEAVTTRDWPGARRRIDRLGLGPQVWVAVSDREGRRLLNTSPLATAAETPRLPRPANVTAALTASGPVISDLFTGSATGRKVVAVDEAVPDSPDELVVSVVADPVALLPTAAEIAAPAPALITIVDRRHRVIARSRDHGRWAGVSATPAMIAHLVERPEGIVASRSLDGEPTVVAFTRSELTGWTTMVVTPRATFLKPVVRNGVAFGLLAAGLLLLGIGLSRFFGTALIGDLRRLEADAERLGRGQAVSPRPSRISNIDLVQTALSAASEELQLRASRQRLMINELNHRVKNTLATVQGLAMQTFRQADADAPAKFDHRLVALANAHDLLTQTSWEPVDIRTLVERCSEAPGSDVVWSGPSAMLPPHAALALCMCLHELGTNSVKYGALSAPGGKVFLSWTRSEAGEIDLLWREQGGPVIGPPARHGFGTRLIDRLVRTELGGAVSREYPPDGLKVRLCFTPPVVERWSNDFA